MKKKARSRGDALFWLLVGFTSPWLAAGLMIRALADPAPRQTLTRLHPPTDVTLTSPPSQFPVQLILDDGTAEVDFGVLEGASSRPFLWLNAFQPSGPFTLHEIWVLFPQEPFLKGAEVELVVLQDDNDDLRDGAHLVRSIRTVVKHADGRRFSVYAVSPPVSVDGHLGGTQTETLYLGVLSRFAEAPSTPPTAPGVLDSDGVGDKSWVVLWPGPPPIPPHVVTGDEVFLIDEIVTGHWLIRGFGEPVDGEEEIPALDRVALGLLGAWLAAAALLLLRKRQGKASK